MARVTSADSFIRLGDHAARACCPKRIWSWPPGRLLLAKAQVSHSIEYSSGTLLCGAGLVVEELLPLQDSF
jgi:hypothetical protein